MSGLTTEDTEDTEKRRLLVQLAAGLLASGHYTETHPCDDEPKIKGYDVGKSWLDDGYPRKRPFHVLDDAEELLSDIEFYISRRAENE